MHIILGVLGVVVTLLVLLNRLQEGGIDIGWLNPFSWRRRRKFRKEYEMSAAYTLDNPMDVAALFMVAIAKSDGDMSMEQKQRVLGLFQSEFSLSDEQAQELLNSSVHIFGRGDEVFRSPESVLHRSKDRFSTEQVNSVLFMLKEIASVEGEPSAKQTQLIEAFNNSFAKAISTDWQH